MCSHDMICRYTYLADALHELFDPFSGSCTDAQHTSVSRNLLDLLGELDRPAINQGIGVCIWVYLIRTGGSGHLLGEYTIQSGGSNYVLGDIFNPDRGGQITCLVSSSSLSRTSGISILFTTTTYINKQTNIDKDNVS